MPRSRRKKSFRHSSSFYRKLKRRLAEESEQDSQTGLQVVNTVDTNEAAPTLTDLNIAAEESSSSSVSDNAPGCSTKVDEQAAIDAAIEEEEENIENEFEEEIEKKLNFTEEIRDWALSNPRVPHSAINDLLKRLKKHKLSVPKDVRTLLKTPTKVEIVTLGTGQFWYNGIKTALADVLELRDLTTISLIFNIDGLPPFRSSPIEFWPILMKVDEIPNLDPMVVGIFCGNTKPILNLFLEEFVLELKELLETGIRTNEGKYVQIFTKYFVCDTPARCFVKGTVGFTSAHGCIKCTTVGDYDRGGRHMSFPRIDCPLRTNESFREKLDEDHHKEDSPLLELPIDMVKQFIVADSLHILDLAVDLDLTPDTVQDAFVIAVEDRAKEKLERIAALQRVTPIDMAKLSQQLNQEAGAPISEDLNGFISNSPLYITSLTATENSSSLATGSRSPGGVFPGTTSVVAVSRAGAAGKQQPARAHVQPANRASPLLGNDVRAAGAATTTVTTAQTHEDSAAQRQITGDIRKDESHDQTCDVKQQSSTGDRRSSSPFQNGRTELLIGPEDNKFKTTAIVENNNNRLLGVESAENRPRRRSGSSIVVLDSDLQEPIKRPPEDLIDGTAFDMVTMVPPGSGDGGVPHREMAVDVPESFVARNKTPPRYPPPKPIKTPNANGTTMTTTLTHNHVATPTPPTSVLPPKPVPPPRDHLKIEADGRLVNRAPAPQLPARINNNNNLVTTLTDIDGKRTSVVSEPTKEQMESIKKYQEQFRKRKEEEDRIAAQNEFLNRSLRGSRKLQALENKPQGAINDAFEDEVFDSRTATPVSDKEREVVHQVYAYGDLVAAAQRLQIQLKKHSAGSGISGLEGRIAAIQSLLLSPQFGKALDIHNRIQKSRSKTAVRAAPSAQTALRDALDALQTSQSAYAVELATLLTGYEFEALMIAHDGVASVLPPDSTSPEPSHPPSETTPSVKSEQSRYSDQNIKIIRIEKTSEPLGATVRNDGDAVVIGRVVRGGAAEKSGLLHEGDEILEVNGIEMRGKSVNAVCDILKDMDGALTILVVPASQYRSHVTRDMVLHVRALFDYDPEDDMYIPCRELGMSFRKGDVLHVISQEDANWWQAYREGEEDQTLAGLVPSLSFQHQRESMRISAEERMSKPHKKSTATLLCGGSAKKKKRKGAYDEGGYPMYSTDDCEPEEILTYEEVSLYYPRSDKKRPIVLIGPPDIGRHELRQRLMENSERFAAAIPHTSRARKESEVDGQDYHFITRAQFEADILSRKFVEHGEYEKAYYGTSLDAIRSVVNSGKICVLNLHPQSLKILRTSDLKPYVVFVAPPNLENLKIRKDRLGESYKEEDLVDIIEKAREMEQKYGHFFDMIIINTDTERAYHDLLSEINSLEREPQWVPAAWVKSA